LIEVQIYNTLIFNGMESKKLIWFGMSVGLILGGFIPMLWGAGEFSMSSIIFSAVGGFLGIWLGFKLSQ
jgi:hypothetical protein